MKVYQTRTYLAARYGVCRQTITKILRGMGITHRGHLSAKDLQAFFDLYGTPGELKDSFFRIRKEG